MAVKKKKKKQLNKDEEKEEAISRRFISSHDKQIVFKELLKQFKDWTHWQRKIVICRCMERSSISFLTSLSTILEPIFHRDFEVVSSEDGFNSSLIKTFVTQEDEYSNDFDSLTVTDIINGESDTSPRSRSGSNRSLSKRRNKSPFDEVELSLPLIPKNAYHRHVLHRNADSLSTIDFYKCDYKNMTNSARECKSDKWRLPQIKINAYNISSKRSMLKTFNEISAHFLNQYCMWKNAEKGDFLLHLTDIFTPQDLCFLANCIYQRLTTINCINRLPDKAMVNIFNFLEPVELSNVAVVCKRWNFISSHHVSWKNKCYLLVHKYNQQHVLQYLESKHAEFDWKLIYKELLQSVKQIDLQTMTELNHATDKGSCEETADLPTPVEGNSTVHIPQNQVNDKESVNCITVKDSILVGCDDDVDDNSDDMPVEMRLSGSDLREEISTEREIQLKQVESNHDVLVENESEINQKESSRDTSQEELSSVHSMSQMVQEDERDQALDVRLRLIQATNTAKKQKKNKQKKLKNVSDEFTRVHIEGLKSVKRVRKLQGHFEAVLCLMFDSKRVMTGSADRTARLWDVRSGRNFYKLKGHQGGIRSIHFDDKYIVTGSWDMTVMIWDVVHFALLHVIKEHTGCVSCLLMNDKMLVTGSHDATVCAFEKDSWKLLFTLKGHDGPVSSLLLISEDELLTVSFDKVMILWDLKSQAVIHRFDDAKSGITCVKLYGSLLAAGMISGEVSFWDLSTRQLEGTIRAHEGSTNALCFVGTRFITGGADHLVKEWDLTTCTCLRSLTGHKAAVNCVRASAKRIISGSSDGTVRIWDFVCNVQQTGGAYDEMNKIIIQSKVVHESQLQPVTHS